MSSPIVLPGQLIPGHSDHELLIKREVMRLCQLDHDRFPGSQPVSFGSRDLPRLGQEDFWVCEKSDGVRVLLLICTMDKNQAVYIIDRHNTYRELQGLFFPHHENPHNPLRSTIIDGELVCDVDPKTRRETLRFLAFDCLVVDEQNVMSRPLDKRYGRLIEWFYKPYQKMIRDHPHVAQRQPFDIKVKEIRVSYHVEDVFNVDILALQHGNDGLIYTCVNAPYRPGTDSNILKWKPPSENSIDFKLVLRFPPSKGNAKKPDFCAKPIFALHVWTGDERGEPKYEKYDHMLVEDDEWEKMKESGEQIDDRIVEVYWDTQRSAWRMIRFRDDKPRGNHRSVVENIIQSIADGVEKDAIMARSGDIRNAWKARQAQHTTATPAAPLATSSSMLGPPPLAKPMRPRAEIRYGPLAPSAWSKVGGPTIVAGFKR